MADYVGGTCASWPLRHIPSVITVSPDSGCKILEAQIVFLFLLLAYLNRYANEVLNMYVQRSLADSRSHG